MAVTWQGPASMTVTRSTLPSSPKSCVIPIFFPRRAATIASDELDLDVHTRWKVVEPLKRVDGLRRGLMNVDQPLVGADFEVLARVLVLERAADDAVDVLLGGQRYRTGDGRAGALGRLDDLLGGRLDRRVVIGLEPYADLVLSYRCHLIPSDIPRADPFTKGPAPWCSSVEPELLDDLGHHPCADRAPALANGEAQTLVPGDRLDQLDGHLDV